MQGLYRLLLKSDKFLNWKPDKPGPMRPQDPAVSAGERALEKHYSAGEVAKVWGISVDLVRSLFRGEPDVLALDRTKRGKYLSVCIRCIGLQLSGNG
jgi:hypothetical protein